MPFVLALSAAAAPAAAAERRYSVTDFDRVQVDGPYEVTLATGASSQASVSGDQAAIDRVSLDVQGRTLRIRPSASAWGAARNAPAGPVRFTLSTRALRGASVTGAGSLSVDRAGGLRLDFTVSGSGSLVVGSVDADNLSLGVVGAGEMRIGGKAKIVRATAAGSGELDASGLVAEDLELSTGTSGRVTIAARRKARVSALGRGSVVVSGSPSCNVTGPAAGQVRCGD